MNKKELIFSSSALADRCRALHSKTGNLALVAALSDSGGENLRRIRAELEKVKREIQALESALLLQESKRSHPLQPSFLP